MQSARQAGGWGSVGAMLSWRLVTELTHPHILLLENAFLMTLRFPSSPSVEKSLDVSRAWAEQDSPRQPHWTRALRLCHPAGLQFKHVIWRQKLQEGKDGGRLGHGLRPENFPVLLREEPNANLKLSLSLFPSPKADSFWDNVLHWNKPRLPSAHRSPRANSCQPRYSLVDIHPQRASK